MYLWKYWRETRIIFGTSLVSIAIMFVLNLWSHNVDPLQSFDQLLTIIPTALALQAFPIIFIAWLLGSFGVGRDLGERSGSFLFSRPRSRGFFVWHDWGLGMTQLLLIVVLLNLVLGVQMHRLLVSAGSRFQGTILLSGTPVALTSVVCLNCGAAFLLAGLVFSLTYFSTVVVKHARGVILGMGSLLAYIVFAQVAKHYSAEIHLPSLILPLSPQFTLAHRAATGFKDHLVSSIVGRACIILLFPVAAQFVLQKMDITD
jgi:hypothetical protein